MPPLTDPVRCRCYRAALANWRYEGYVNFGKDASRWLRAELPDYSAPRLKELLYEYVWAEKDCRRVDEQRETRPKWQEHEFHYDLRVRIDSRLVYFETRLICRDLNDPDDPLIQVVNAHDA
jgi:hypothetical protein